ncbi:uncharacterized protein LOC144365562 [Ictidomys tridecemlineatus]
MGVHLLSANFFWHSFTSSRGTFLLLPTRGIAAKEDSPAGPSVSAVGHQVALRAWESRSPSEAAGSPDRIGRAPGRGRGVAGAAPKAAINEASSFSLLLGHEPKGEQSQECALSLRGYFGCGMFGQC